MTIVSLQVLTRGSIFLNTSLTESFGIAILEAACAGLYVVSTRVGGVPEILPEDMISFAKTEEDGASHVLSDFTFLSTTTQLIDVVRALSEAISIVSAGNHSPWRAHERVKDFYSWTMVAERTEKVYHDVLSSPEKDLWTRMQRSGLTSSYQPEKWLTSVAQNGDAWTVRRPDILHYSRRRLYLFRGARVGNAET